MRYFLDTGCECSKGLSALLYCLENNPFVILRSETTKMKNKQVKVKRYYIEDKGTLHIYENVVGKF